MAEALRELQGAQPSPQLLDISRWTNQIVHLPVNERGCPFSLGPSPPHKDESVASTVNSYRFLPPSDGGEGWWHRRDRWNLYSCQA
jgi:hypothetical protein